MCANRAGRGDPLDRSDRPLNAKLRGLVEGSEPVLTAIGTAAALIKDSLGAALVGLYLEGSIVTGDFNPDSSDIDLIAVSHRELEQPRLTSLSGALDSLKRTYSPWMCEVELTVLPEAGVAGFDPDAPTPAWVLERGPQEHLKPWLPDPGWLVHLHRLKTLGITLYGPDPSTCVRDVTPSELRQAMRSGAARWSAGYLGNPQLLLNPGTRVYVVLTCCRMLYTSRSGAIASKPAAGRWGLEQLAAEWHPCVRAALAWRKTDTQVGITPEQCAAMLRLTQHALREAPR